jgi:hypothetical protein
MTSHILRCRDDWLTSVNSSMHSGRCQLSRTHYFWRMWAGSVHGVYYLKQISPLANFHDALKTWHNLEINTNWRSRQVIAEKSSDCATQSEPSNRRAKVLWIVATRISWVRPHFASFYQLILTGIASGWRTVWWSHIWARWGWSGWSTEWSANASATEKEKTNEVGIKSHKEFSCSTFHSSRWSTLTDLYLMEMNQ